VTHIVIEDLLFFIDYFLKSEFNLQQENKPPAK